MKSRNNVDLVDRLKVGSGVGAVVILLGLGGLSFLSQVYVQDPETNTSVALPVYLGVPDSITDVLYSNDRDPVYDW